MDKKKQVRSQEIVEKIREENRLKDEEWEKWRETPESIFDIIQDPVLGIKPSERYVGSEKLRELISRLKLPRPPSAN